LLRSPCCLICYVALLLLVVLGLLFRYRSVDLLWFVPGSLLVVAVTFVYAFDLRLFYHGYLLVYSSRLRSVSVCWFTFTFTFALLFFGCRLLI